MPLGLAVDFVHQRQWRFSVIRWHEVGQYGELTHLTCALLMGTDLIHNNSCSNSPMHVGQHAFRSKQCKTVIISPLQLVGDRRPPCHPNNIETRASIPCRSHQTPLKLFDLYFAHSWRRRGWPWWQDITLADAGPASCMPVTRIAWPPPPGNLG